MSDIFHTLCDAEAWEEFFIHKSQKEPENSPFLRELRNYIDSKSYLDAAERLRGSGFSIPTKKLISKKNSSKKRTVYTFPQEENLLLKFIARQLKRYDRIFAPNLYSFRLHKTAKDAWCRIADLKNLEQKYVYKVDISDYFCSVDPALILPDLKEVLKDDPALYKILEDLLTNPRVLDRGKVQKEDKGILPGVPTSAFLANLFLKDLDFFFFRSPIEYMRYSDDIIIFADSPQQLDACVEKIRDFLREKHLKINKEKEIYTPPGKPWEFLGFSYDRGTIDVSEVALEKLKAKMRRKARALTRWADKKGLPGTYAAKAFVKRFHAKIFDNPHAGELTWARWYFPVITTHKTLKKIDAYAEDTIRSLATGKRTKKRFDFRYDNIKSLGYKSLVNAYYRFKKGEGFTE